MKSGMLFFGLLLTFMLTANLASAQSCQPAACSKVADKGTCAKTTTASTATVMVDEIIKMVANTAANPAVTPSCAPDKCTEEQKKNCATVCPPGCCKDAKSMKTADAKPAPKEAKSSTL